MQWSCCARIARDFCFVLCVTRRALRDCALLGKWSQSLFCLLHPHELVQEQADEEAGEKMWEEQWQGCWTQVHGQSSHIAHGVGVVEHTQRATCVQKACVGHVDLSGKAHLCIYSPVPPRAAHRSTQRTALCRSNKRDFQPDSMINMSSMCA